MPGCPAAAVDSAGAAPELPASNRTAGIPRQTGAEGDGDRVALRLAGAVAVAVALTGGVPVVLAGGEPLALTVALDDAVPVWLAVALDEALPVWLDVELPLAVALRDALFEEARSEVTLRPRYVMVATAASSASHSVDSYTPLA